MYFKQSLSHRKLLYKKFFTSRYIAKDIYDFFKCYFLNQAVNPLAFTLMLTSVCNNNCKMCFESEELNNSRKKHLEFSIIENLVNQIKDKRMFIFLSGGEPFMHPEIQNILALFEKNKIYYGICTNGTLLNKNEINYLSKSNINYIIFSLHGLEKNHDKITGHKDSFQKIVQAIKELKIANTNNLIIINYTILPHNISDMRSAVELCEQIGVDIIRFQDFNFLTNQELKKHYQIFSSHLHYINQHISDNIHIDYQELSKEINQIKNKKYSIPILFSPELKNKERSHWYSNKFITKRKCNFIFRTAFIDYRGNVFPCRTIRYKLGNLNSNTLKESFNSRKAKEFRKKIKKDLLPGCSRCCNL